MPDLKSNEGEQAVGVVLAHMEVAVEHPLHGGVVEQPLFLEA